MQKLQNTPFSFNLIVAGIFLIIQECKAQCCSPGNPVGGTSALGVLDKGSAKLFLNYKYGYSGNYYEGSKPTSSQFIKDGNYNYGGINLLFGISDRLTAELETGYFLNKTQNFVEGVLPEQQIGSGITDINLGVKFNFYKNKNKELEITSGGGVKVPLGSHNQTNNGVLVPYDLQPTSGATDFIHNLFLYKGLLPLHLRFFLINRMDFKGKNKEQYRYGNFYTTSFFISYSLSDHWIFLTQFRSEIRERDTRPSSGNGIQQKDGRESIIVTGSKKIFAIPQATYVFSKNWAASVLIDIPLYQYYNNKQLASTYAVSLSISKEFKPKNKKIKPLP